MGVSLRQHYVLRLQYSSSYSHLTRSWLPRRQLQQRRQSQSWCSAPSSPAPSLTPRQKRLAKKKRKSTSQGEVQQLPELPVVHLGISLKPRQLPASHGSLRRDTAQLPPAVPGGLPKSQQPGHKPEFVARDVSSSTTLQNEVHIGSLSPSALVDTSKTWAASYRQLITAGGSASGTLMAQQFRALVSAASSQLQQLDQQQLATIAWAAAHAGRQVAVPLYQEMAVPFEVIPCCFPNLKLQDFLAEVDLRRDAIKLDGGSRVVPEARMTAWQSDIGATFVYSGKEMQPPVGGMTRSVAQVRDRLAEVTGVHYDSVLVNLYEDGKVGMRFHADPLYGCWTERTAVVSLGHCRRFVFRSTTDFAVRWEYEVHNGDVVVMFGDCQQRLQHSIKVEPSAEDAGPRMSLVFKERIRHPDGSYV